MFSMVQPPRLAARADSRGWARNGLLGMFAGLLFALLLRTVWSASDRLRADDPAEYQGWLATVRDIRRNVWRP